MHNDVSAGEAKNIPGQGELSSELASLAYTWDRIGRDLEEARAGLVAGLEDADAVMISEMLLLETSSEILMCPSQSRADFLLKY